MPLQARMTFTMARQVLAEMTHSFDVPPSRYTGGDRLDHGAFVQFERQLAEAGFQWNTPDASYLVLPLQGWSAGDTAKDHWVRAPMEHWLGASRRSRPSRSARSWRRSRPSRRYGLPSVSGKSKWL